VDLICANLRLHRRALFNSEGQRSVFKQGSSGRWYWGNLRIIQARLAQEAPSELFITKKKKKFRQPASYFPSASQHP
jgi:hypothetical protein